MSNVIDLTSRKREPDTTDITRRTFCRSLTAGELESLTNGER